MRAGVVQGVVEIEEPGALRDIQGQQSAAKTQFSQRNRNAEMRLPCVAFPRPGRGLVIGS
jgi:hypothetical protein